MNIQFDKFDIKKNDVFFEDIPMDELELDYWGVNLSGSNIGLKLYLQPRYRSLGRVALEPCMSCATNMLNKAISSDKFDFIKNEKSMSLTDFVCEISNPMRDNHRLIFRYYEEDDLDKKVWRHFLVTCGFPDFADHIQISSDLVKEALYARVSPLYIIGVCTDKTGIQSVKSYIRNWKNSVIDPLDPEDKSMEKAIDLQKKLLDLWGIQNEDILKILLQFGECGCTVAFWGVDQKRTGERIYKTYFKMPEYTQSDHTHDALFSVFQKINIDLITADDVNCSFASKDLILDLVAIGYDSTGLSGVKLYYAPRDERAV